MFSLGRNSPHITNLTISLEGDSFLPSWPIIDSFKHMPLRYLDLHSVAFDWGEYTAHESGNEEPPVYHPPTGWRDFLAAVPLLEEFILSYQTIDSSTLPIFATMLPHLRLLELDMIIFSGDEEVLSAVGWSPTTQLITLQIGVCEIARESGILNVARLPDTFTISGQM
ncbi:hypothetical protein FRC09_018345 [Ceratobasidium sp. 395]|nr:hypothetical protein FRC09_018345 [Ceratobasidium sp. 395]